MTTPPPPFEHMKKCSACGYGDCDFRIQGCGCMMHARCTPSPPIDPKPSCPSCGKLCDGIHILPIRVSEAVFGKRESTTPTEKKGGEDGIASPTLGSSTGSTLYSSCAPMTFVEPDSPKGSSSYVGGLAPKDEHDSLLATERTGRWTKAELAYVGCLTNLFDSGRLLIADGTKLIDFLSGMIKCKASRLTKKLTRSNLARGYVYKAGGEVAENFAVVSNFSRCYDEFASSFPAKSEEELRLWTSSLWRNHFVEFGAQREQMHSQVSLFRNAEPYLRSVELLERRCDALRKEKRKRLKRDAIERSSSFAHTSSKKMRLSMAHHQHFPTFPRTETLCNTLNPEDVEPLPVVNAVLRTVSSSSAAPDATTTLGSGLANRVSTVSLNGEDEVTCDTNGDEDSTADEDFLSLWGLPSTDDASSLDSFSTHFSPMSVQAKGDNALVERVPTPVVSAAAKPMAFHDHASAATKSPLSADASVGTCARNGSAKSYTAPTGAAVAKTNPNKFGFRKEKKFDHPFLAKLFDYAKNSSLPFEYFDLWVPTFVDGEEEEEAAAAIVTMARTSSSQNSNLRLIHAGHFVHAAGGAIPPEKLTIFGDYSSHFQLSTNQGMPGRVHFARCPCWEQSVQFASTDHFERAEGAAMVGIRTAVGIPVTSDGSGTVVVGCYSTQDLPKDDELVERMWKDFAAWNPAPRWKLVVDERLTPGTCQGTMEDVHDPVHKSPRKERHLPIDNPKEPMVASKVFAPDTPPSNASSVPQDVKPSADHNAAVVKEILTLLAECIPMPMLLTTNKEDMDLLPGFMSLRLMLLRIEEKRTPAERAILKLICGSYRGYMRAGGVRRPRKVMGSLLVREFMFLTFAVPPTTPEEHAITRGDCGATQQEKRGTPAAAPLVLPRLMAP